MTCVVCARKVRYVLLTCSFQMPLDTPLLTAPELNVLVRHRVPDVFIFDCRFSLADEKAGLRAYAEGHIPGAYYAHLNRDLSDMSAPPSEGRHPLPEPAAFCAWLSRHGAAPHSRYVAYDDAGGAIAARFWWMLRTQGAMDAQVLDGGLPAWTGAGGELEPGQPPASPEPAVKPSWPVRPWPVVSREDVRRAAAAGHLIDARDARRYHGIEEPIDPVAGHIDGARNLPFKELLAADGHLLPREELESRWRSASAHPSSSVVYCGSGVTACHLILSAVAAGFRPPRLFAPSWSGYIAQEGLSGP